MRIRLFVELEIQEISYEIALMNKKLDSDIETITLFSTRSKFISSTLVREISQFNLDKWQDGAR